MVVDDEERACLGCQRADTTRELQQLAPSQGFVAQLNDVSATAQRCGCQVDDAVGRRVGRDDVEVSGEESVLDVS